MWQSKEGKQEKKTFFHLVSVRDLLRIRGMQTEPLFGIENSFASPHTL